MSYEDFAHIAIRALERIADEPDLEKAQWLASGALEIWYGEGEK
jgi:hypothetical protein